MRNIPSRLLTVEAMEGLWNAAIRLVLNNTSGFP